MPPKKEKKEKEVLYFGPKVTDGENVFAIAHIYASFNNTFCNKCKQTILFLSLSLFLLPYFTKEFRNILDYFVNYAYLLQNLDSLFTNHPIATTEKDDANSLSTHVATTPPQQTPTIPKPPPPTPVTALKDAVVNVFSTASDSKVNYCSQATQVDEYELENMEMRTLLPFRSKGYHSIRSNYPTSFDQNVYGVNGIMPPSATENKSYFQTVLNSNGQFSSTMNTPATSAITDKPFQLKEDSHMLRSKNNRKSMMGRKKLQKVARKKDQESSSTNIAAASTESLQQGEANSSTNLAQQHTEEDATTKDTQDHHTDALLTAALEDDDHPLAQSSSFATVEEPETTKAVSFANEYIRDNLVDLNDLSFAASEVNYIDLEHSYIFMLQQRFFELVLRVNGLISKQSLSVREKFLMSNKEPNQILSQHYLTKLPLQLLETSFSVNFITFLDLSNNFLTFLPNWFFDTMKYLQNLNLKQNYFVDLPSSFSELKRLKECNLSFNKFEIIPQGLFDLPSLTQLDLSHNYLMSVPNEFCKLGYVLTDLNLSHNLLVDLPLEFKTFKKTKQIQMTNNFFIYTTHVLVLKKLSGVVADRDSLDKMDKNDEEQTPEGSASASSLFSGSSGSSSTGSFETEKRDDVSVLKGQMNLSKVLILMELLESERRYIHKFNLFYELYVIPMKQQLQQSGSPKPSSGYDFTISEKELSELIPYELNSIKEFHQLFLATLHERFATFESNLFQLHRASVADLFLDKMKSFKSLYVQYIEIYDKALLKFTHLKKTYPDWEKWLVAKKKLTISGGMDLECYLKLPLNRLRRYSMLLGQLVKATKPTHSDFYNLKQAQKQMNDLILEMDYHFFRYDNKYRILELQKKLKLKHLYDPTRILIHFGKVNVPPSKEIQMLKKDIAQKKKNLTFEGVKNMKVEDVQKHVAEASYIKDWNLNSIWDLRLTENSVTLYLFNDCMVIKENNILHKIVVKAVKYDLHGAEVQTSEENEREFMIRYVEKNRLFAFIAESVDEMRKWVNQFQKAINSLQEDSETESSEAEEIGSDQFEDEEDLEEFDPLTSPRNGPPPQESPRTGATAEEEANKLDKMKKKSKYSSTFLARLSNNLKKKTEDKA